MCSTLYLSSGSWCLMYCSSLISSRLWVGVGSGLGSVVSSQWEGSGLGAHVEALGKSRVRGRVSSQWEG
eukprot:scaffold50213_cov57-Phaeocystis_antarctica.AAC.3